MTTFSTLQQPAVAAALDRMFAAAEQDAAAELPASPGTRTAQELADAYAGLYLPISAEGGGLLYSLVRAARPETIVEFGTSFGISTLYLAAAVRDNGAGRVLSTELSAAKVAAARRTFAETGLDDVITVLEGDARESLVPHLDGGVSFVLLDGWKDLYLPVLHLLEPHLAPGTLVVADDAAMASVRPYLDYVRSPENGYQSTSYPVEDGMEISCRL
ncbi:MAG TPA: class I SAM-dependent methyltransferase [Actinospica sp.]|jgi:predicted O-methyltransferase YrrM|nr:class I SAM-dependent methyltransferase [Actinospica sp.]